MGQGQPSIKIMFGPSFRSLVSFQFSEPKIESDQGSLSKCLYGEGNICWLTAQSGPFLKQ